MSFEVKELENWQKKLLKRVGEFPNKKRKELKKLAVITQGQIKPLIPVDTAA